MDIKEYENYHERKEHGVEIFPYNTYLCSIPLDFGEVPVHWHDEMEMIYIKKGRGLVSVEFQEQMVEAGEFAIVLPGQMHGICQYEKESMEYENILFRPEMLYAKKEDGTGEKYFRPLLHMKMTVPSFYRKGQKGYEEIRSCLDDCDKISAVSGEGYELLLKSSLFRIFHALYMISEKNTRHAQKTTHEGMKAVVKYVELHYMEKLTIDDMAHLAGFSSSHFMKYFKATMGQSFIDYLNDYRLMMASRLLLASTEPILMIAQEVGYDNISYFNRIFKRRFGVTPREYRGNTGEKYPNHRG